MDRTISRKTFILGIAAGAILLAGRSRLPSRASAQSPETTPYLVDAEWLAEQIELATPNLLVIDVSDLADYRSAHIPGAIHSYWLETVERDYDVYGTVLNQKDIDSDEDGQGKRLEWLRRHGIGPDTWVVAYDRSDARRSARIVWFLRFLGHERASLLDQGFAGWEGIGLATNDRTESPPALTAEPVASPLTGFYVGTEELQELIDRNEIVLVDIRTDEERLDTIDGQFGVGVIPGSLHIPWDQPEFNLTAFPNAFDPAAARAALISAGVEPSRRIVLYGRFGSDANQMWLVLKAAGYEQVEIFDRGWVMWERSGLLAEQVS